MIERYEYKYLVDASVVPEIRHAALAVGTRDPYADANGLYVIRSLYLDTDRYHLYMANDRQAHDRFKARIRTYPGKKAPTFLEIKRRTGDVIRKTRAAVGAGWERLVRGDLSVPVAPQYRAAADNFVERTLRYHLEPKHSVEYTREAFASSIDAYARLTIDTKLHGQPVDRWTTEVNEHLWRPIDVGLVSDGRSESVSVLELKFERRPPRWMVALVKRLGLERKAFSKYGYTVETQLTLPELRTPAHAGHATFVASATQRSGPLSARTRA